MKHTNVIAIDLAKNSFQVCVLKQNGNVPLNQPMTRKRVAAYLAKQPPAIVAMEACGGAHYWGRLAQAHGHEVRLLSPRWVSPYRQGHKTDSKDVLAIAIACRQPKLRLAGLMSVEQQALQSEKRVQEHLSDQLTATGNMLRALVSEFGLVIPRGVAALRRRLPEILADAENGLPLSMRASLHAAWELWQHQARVQREMEKRLVQRVKTTPACQALEKLESVGSKNAIGLYVALGDGRHYKNGREAAACIGVTPKQHSSGGKVKLGSIGKFKGNQRLRSSLIVGAWSVVKALGKREPRSEKERWVKALMERRGPGRAAVALANKTVRTAWAMLYYNTPYQPAADPA